MWVMLAIAVFAWGLQYKLSLYPGEQAVPHHVPMAKLLSNDKQQGAAQIAMSRYVPDQTPMPGLTTLLWPCLTLVLGALLLVTLHQLSRAVAWARSAFPPALRGAASLFFRPPPMYFPAVLPVE